MCVGLGAVGGVSGWGCVGVAAFVGTGFRRLAATIGGLRVALSGLFALLRPLVAPRVGRGSPVSQPVDDLPNLVVLRELLAELIGGLTGGCLLSVLAGLRLCLAVLLCLLLARVLRGLVGQGLLVAGLSGLLALGVVTRVLSLLGLGFVLLLV